MALFFCVTRDFEYRLESAYTRLALVYTLKALQSPSKRFKRALRIFPGIKKGPVIIQGLKSFIN